MRISASNGCWLTESQEPAEGRRTFVKDVFITSVEEISRWREVTDTEKENIDLNDRLLNPDDLNYKYIKQVDTLLEGITSKINTLGLTAEEALDVQSNFPRWENLIGEDESAGFRFQYGETLYEVIQPHTFSAEWVPGQGTESLYKVVQEEHEGTREDPIPWQRNMELAAGKYYTDKGVLYLCVRDSGIALSYDLADLVSGGYVEPVEEPEQPEEGSGEDTGDGEETTPAQPAEPDGTRDNPIPYTARQTPLEQGKYYTEDGQLYLCIQQGGVVIYDLSQIPAIAQPVNE